MAQFIFFAAVLVLLAVLLAVAMLWQKSRGLALAIAIGVPLAAAAVYYLKGQPEALDPQQVATPATMEEAVAQLEQRLAGQPDNFEGTALLARSYMALGRFPEAESAYARALALKPDETDLSVEYAEAMLRAAPDKRFPEGAVAILEKAVEANPQNQRALFFLGLQRLQSDRPADASEIWEKLLPLLDPAAARELYGQINQARSQAGLAPLPELTAPASATANAAKLSLQVKLDPALAASLPPGAVLFVFARSPDGKGPPFAAKRVEGAEFPLQLDLSDDDSPMPAAKLSTQSRVQVMARLSLKGDARPASGDIESLPVEVSMDQAQAVELMLDQRLP